MDFYTRLLPRATKKALEFLSKADWLKNSDWYLAGGTALALSMGHRVSMDLDFFSSQKTFLPQEVIRHFSDEVWHGDVVKEGTLYGKLFGAKVSFIAYPFFIPKAPVLRYGTVRVLPPEDIAVMKIIAISQRGKKRDFLDLYWYVQHQESLAEVLKRLPEQYPTVAHDYHHILKSLTYFADAEEDPMPKLFFKANWKEIKTFFQKEVTRIAKERWGE